MTDSILTIALSAFTGFFAVMNPFAITPIYVGLVEGRSKKAKLDIAKKATLTAFIIVGSFIILGNFIFELFGISIGAFKMAGGILIFFVGFDMLQSKPSKLHGHENENLSMDESIAISPLAIPILAGPGTIITAMNNVTGGGFTNIWVTIVVLAFMLLLTYWAFIKSNLLIKKLGENMIDVIGKLMGLILTIIGVGMVADGIKIVFNL